MMDGCSPFFLEKKEEKSRERKSGRQKGKNDNSK